ncbi:MAG: EAL domain-containing protein [Methylococcaceae bacterium]|nr:EAL domain-containing protein [Methylococcaceae bacterium]
MIKLLRNLSIKKKLLSIQVFSSIAGLFLAAILLLLFEIVAFKQNAQHDLSAMAELIGNRSTAALLFDDPGLAKENLASLEQLSIFHSACIYNKQGRIFTRFKSQKYPESVCPEKYSGQSTYFEQTLLHVYVPIVLDVEQIGVIYILANLDITFLRKLQSIGLLCTLLFAASVVTFLLTAPLLRVITGPLNKLLKIVNIITQEKDYSRRAIKQNEDELGELVDAFNDMIATVEQQNRALTVAKDHYRALYDDNPTMVFNVTTDGIILSVNSFGARQLDLTSKELQDRSIFDFIHPDDQLIAKMLFDSCIATPFKIHKYELRKICRDGRVIWVRETARLINNENQQKNILLVCEDVTETRILAEKVAYQASHDALTGLVNRTEFDIILHKAVEEAHEKMTEHTLCYLDLDQFKLVNDTSGHMAGDELLRQLGETLRLQIRKGDVLARLGGDEFGILMNNCSLEEAFHACEKLRNLIRGFQFAWENRSFYVGVSIGITSINNCSANAVEILKEADAACYAAKDKGRNRVHVFRPDDEELASRQGEMQWVEKIQYGIDKNHFVLYGQLIVPISTNQEGLHFETLIRFKDKKGKIIPPGAFLPAAERYNMASAIDRWVISHLFEWISKQQDFLDKLSLCSINLSGLSLSDESMLNFITNAFYRYSIPTEKICFEITETVAISSLSNATQFINHLRERGCSFSLDDFGSGLSSFAYLKNLPVDYLKIDGLFVKDILDDQVDLAMVRSINEVGHVMGKKTIAEFVENEQIFNLLKVLGVDYAQGYGIAKPVPLDELKW